MYKLDVHQLKRDALVSRFLANPQQAWLAGELTALLNKDYQTFLTDIYWDTNIIGFLSVLNRLDGLMVLSTALPSPKIQEMIKANNYAAFRKAAQKGHLEVINYLVEASADLLPAMMKAKNYAAFHWAAEQGHLALVKYLVGATSDLLSEMMKAIEYISFRSAAANGHLAIVKYLVQTAPDLLSEMIKADNYFAFRWAARQGHLDVVKYLVEIAPDLLSDMVKAGDCVEFRGAAEHRYLDVVITDDYAAFRWAAGNNHLDTIKYLVKTTPDLLSEMMKAKNYDAFHQAVTNGHLAMVNFLLYAADPPTRDILYKQYLTPAQREALFQEHFALSKASQYFTAHQLVEDVQQLILNQAKRVSFFKPVPPSEDGTQLENQALAFKG